MYTNTLSDIVDTVQGALPEFLGDFFPVLLQANWARIMREIVLLATPSALEYAQVFGPGEVLEANPPSVALADALRALEFLISKQTSDRPMTVAAHLFSDRCSMQVCRLSPPIRHRRIETRARQDDIRSLSV